MGEILPDGTIQGYHRYCPICHMEVDCDDQGDVFGHECLLCGEQYHGWTANEKVFCTREKGHPGEHCRNLLTLTGYHNIWWEATHAPEKEGK